MGIQSFWNRVTGKEKKKTPAQQENETDLTQTFARVYMTELWFEQMPDDLKAAQILQGLRAQLGNVKRLGSDSDAKPDAEHLLHFVFEDHTFDFGDGKAPMFMAVMKAERDPGPPSSIEDHYAMSFHQSWLFPDARQRLAQCKFCMLVTDLMSIGMESQERMGVYQRAMFEIVKALQPSAIHWKHSQQFMDAQMYLSNVPSTQDYDVLLGPLNVRMFRIEDSAPNEIVMDTLGLSALGFPDLQIHCHGMDPMQLAGVLNGTGHYLFEHGDVIEDGHTIAGWEASQRWKCQHEESILEPKRIVLDINPGKPFAAGNRN